MRPTTAERNTPPSSRLFPLAMAAKKPIPPEDVIREESGPPITEVKEPDKNSDDVAVDIDDAQIEEPRDDAFRKSSQPVQTPKPRK